MLNTINSAIRYNPMPPLNIMLASNTLEIRHRPGAKQGIISAGGGQICGSNQ